MLLPDSEWERLRELSERRGTTVSELIRGAYQELYWPRSRLVARNCIASLRSRPLMDADAGKAMLRSLFADQ